MISRHQNMLLTRLEDVMDIGATTIRGQELLRWYDQKRITKNIWRDILEKWHEIQPDMPPLLVGEESGIFTFIYGKGLEIGKDSWFKNIESWA